jgi:hypothetical protein
MEPDVNDVADSKANLVMDGVILQQDDSFPIYRYIHDLNEDGSIKGLKTTDAP